MTQETNVYDKRECVHDKRDLHMCADDTEQSDIHTGEKRPTCTTKETYIYDKRDPEMCVTLSRFRPRERIQRITKTHLNK